MVYLKKKEKKISCIMFLAIFLILFHLSILNFSFISSHTFHCSLVLIWFSCYSLLSLSYHIIPNLFFSNWSSSFHPLYLVPRPLRFYVVLIVFIWQTLLVLRCLFSDVAVVDLNFIVELLKVLIRSFFGFPLFLSFFLFFNLVFHVYFSFIFFLFLSFSFHIHIFSFLLSYYFWSCFVPFRSAICW